MTSLFAVRRRMARPSNRSPRFRKCLSGTATISQTRAGSNTATSGAGIYNTGGPLNLWNSLVYSNIATGSGAGIYNTTASASLSAIYNTFFGNGAATSGGGIFNTDGGVVSLDNQSAVVENTPNNCVGTNACGA